MMLAPQAAASLPYASPLHPATLTTLALINAVALHQVDSLLLDGILELSLTCIYEDRPPVSLELWLDRIRILEPEEETVRVLDDIEELVDVLRAGGLDALHGWLNQIKALCPWTEDEEASVSPPPLHRTSPFALFVRRSRMVFFKLSFDEAVRWWEEWHAWCEGRWSGSKDASYSLAAARAYGKARSTSDYQAARDATSFYDADDGLSTQGQAEYALLNTAFLEFEAGGLKSAREALAEAIQVARKVGDARCLVACSSLSRRLDASDPSTASTSKLPDLGDGRVSPTDLLWQIKQSLIDGESVPELFMTLMASRSLYQAPPLNSASKGKGRFTSWNDSPWEASFHAISAALWSELGSNTLASLRNTMALDALDTDTNVWNVRLAVVSRQAALLTTSSRFDEALKILLECVDTEERRYAMGMREFRMWTESVWDVMRVATSRRGQYTLLEGTNRVGSSAERVASGVDVIALLEQGHTYMDQGQPTTALSFYLKALHASSSRHSSSLRLRSVVAVATCRLFISPTVEEARRSFGELDEVWGEILASGESDLELLALGSEAKGRAIVMMAEGNDATISTSLPFWSEANTRYEEMELSAPNKRTLSTLARLSDHLSTGSLPPGMTDWDDLRDQTAKTYREWVEGRAAVMAAGEMKGWKRMGDVGDVVAGVQRAVWRSIASVAVE